MNRARKKFERRQLDDFLHATGLELRVRSIAENERPDFLLTLDEGRRIAIEHTQPRDKIRAAHDQLLPALTRRICQGLEKRGLPLWIHMTLALASARALLGTHDADTIADELLALILHDREGVRSSWVEYSTPSLQNYPILSAFEEIHVSECERSIATWGSHNLNRRLAILQEAIASKTDKLLDYQDNVDADEYWLLVVSGPGLGSIPSLLASQLRHGEGYQQIYLMDEFGQHCFRLES